MSEFSPAENHIFSCYALDGIQPVLFAWDLDMVKLRYYRDGIEQEDVRGLVLCIDFQEETLQRCFGNLADIRPMGAAIFWKELFDGN